MENRMPMIQSEFPPISREKIIKTVEDLMIEYNISPENMIVDKSILYYCFIKRDNQ